eukprot:SAG25_NODE_506_length_7318_cov_2.458374_2_plen_67_part_00
MDREQRADSASAAATWPAGVAERELLASVEAQLSEAVEVAAAVLDAASMFLAAELRQLAVTQLVQV